MAFVKTEIASRRAHGKPRRFAGLIAACALFATPVAANEMIDATDVDEILAIAEGFGSARRDVDNVGDPTIIGRIDGQQYQILFFECTNNADCQSIMFYAYIPGAGIPLAKVASWNLEERFAKTYFDGDGDVVMEWDVNLLGGVTKANFDHTFSIWEGTMARVIEHMK